VTAAVHAGDLMRPARRRSLANDALIGLPVVMVGATLAFRFGGVAAAGVVAIIGIAVIAATAYARTRRLNRRWLIRRLDLSGADMEDSADLLFADRALTPLQALQRERIACRLTATPPELRRPWSTRRIAAAWLTSTIAVATLAALPGARRATILATPDEQVTAAPGMPRLTGQRLRIVPPAYTGLPSRDAGLDARAPAGSQLAWTLTFAPQPAAAVLAFPGRPVPLVRRGDSWTARRVLDRSVLYRVMPQLPPGQPPGQALPRLHRLDAVADAPPQVRVIAPERSLSLVTPGQRRWSLVFATRDDYGVAATAQLHLTVAEGDGENVEFRETVVAVHGTGSGTVKRFAVAPDLAALRFVAGSDLVARLVVSDNRSPGPQAAVSTSLILRWPAATADGAGMEGVVTRVLPAYFRSQRQVIIDAEALLKDRPRLAAARFLARSDGIGADQRLLRLRYGQFLGEEQEGTGPPTADAPAPGPEGDAALPSRSAFGSERNTLADYGHVHDEAEAATLLDPGTRTTLKAALDAMWQSELSLRQGAPQTALPFAYTALRLIKQVQQATRIFLARVGPVLPVIDETRRLTGKRDGLDHRDLPALASVGDGGAAVAWAAVSFAEPSPSELARIEAWARSRPASVVDPLAVAAAIDAVQRDPGCTPCRRALRELVWQALPRPAPGVTRRDGGGAAGRRYLDALGGR